TNSAIAPEIGTMFLTTRPKYNFISSSTVKEISHFGGDISKFVPECVVEYLQRTKKESKEG
ncbi:pantetheine-phosphate adenylyltransferase, partial [Candidatus Gastranaerophilus sp. (ex Termes propinquus)]